MKYVGIIPAAGLGNRLQPLPFSKEMFPFGYQNINGQVRVSPISLHLVNSLREAGIQQLFFVINSQKVDIPRYYSNGSQMGMHFSYLLQPEPKGLVDAIAQVTPWLSEREEVLIFFGMPDTFFQPSSLLKQLKQKMHDCDFDVILGIFPTKTWWKLGMVRFSESKDGLGEITEIIDKPITKPDTDYAWGVAVWRLPFQQYITRQITEFTGEGDLLLGDVFMSAMTDGLRIGSVIGDEYIDIGTIEELRIALTRLYLQMGDDERACEHETRSKRDFNNL